MHEREVEKLIEVSVEEIMNEEKIKTTKVETSKGILIEAPYFDIQGHIVWGATAMILGELKEILKKCF
jgi:hypothetical protein